MRYLLFIGILGIISLGTLFVPTDFSFASDACSGDECGLVTCEGDGCNFDQFMIMVNRVINFLLFTLAPIFATITFTMAGFMILTAGDNSGKVSQAKKMMTNVVVGYLIAVSAWLIVKLIFDKNLVQDGFLFFID